MKKILFLAIAALLCISAFGQVNSGNSNGEKAAAPAGDKPVKFVNGGVINGKARLLAKPAYPAAAKAVRASGAVSVQVLIDEEGNVVSASAISGHPLLRQASERAALESKFAPTTLSGQLVKVSGVIVYNFVLAIDWLALGRDIAKADFEEASSKAAYLPKNFEAEKQIILGLKNESNPGKASEAIESIQSKIYSDAKAASEFSLGLALGRIIKDTDDDSNIRANLFKVKEYFDGQIPDDSSKLRKLKELADFLNDQAFSKKDKLRIKELCDSIY